ncbi:MAG: FkbM family methyltransferase [Bacteroidia bacterium]
MFRKLIIHNLPLTRIKIGIAKILYVFASIIYGKKPRLISQNGINYEVDLSEGIDLSLFLFGSFQKHVTHNKLLSLPKDAVIIDIGANFGVMSLQFAQIAPEGKVYSFEPTHYAIAKLKRNLELNPSLASRIEVINSFLSATSTANANIKAYSSWKVNDEKAPDMHPEHLGAAKSTEGVGAMTLDDFCKSRQLQRLDFIKIDTDGHEYEILQGARETISKYRPQIIFEIGIYVMTEKGIDFTFYSNYFKELNYNMFDSGTTALITLENHKEYIPEKGTIDIIAKPL